MKKGQTEIIGILIIVFIVSIGMFFYLQLKLVQPQKDTFLSYQEQELSHAVKLALLNSYIDGCSHATLYDNIKQMATSGECQGSSIGGAIEAILEPSIGSAPGGAQWKYYYEVYTCGDHFHLPDDTSCDIILQGPSDWDIDNTETNKCAFSKEADIKGVQTYYPVETGSVTYYFKLKLCR